MRSSRHPDRSARPTSQAPSSTAKSRPGSTTLRTWRGWKGRAGASRIAALKQKGDLVNSVASASFRPTDNHYSHSTGTRGQRPDRGQRQGRPVRHGRHDRARQHGCRPVRSPRHGRCGNLAKSASGNGDRGRRRLLAAPFGRASDFTSARAPFPSSSPRRNRRSRAGRRAGSSLRGTARQGRSESSRPTCCRSVPGFCRPRRGEPQDVAGGVNDPHVGLVGNEPADLRHLAAGVSQNRERRISQDTDGPLEDCAAVHGEVMEALFQYRGSRGNSAAAGRPAQEVAAGAIGPELVGNQPLVRLPGASSTAPAPSPNKG